MMNNHLFARWRLAGFLSAVVFAVLLGVFLWSWTAPVPVAQTPSRAPSTQPPSLLPVTRSISRPIDTSTRQTVVLPANPILDMDLIGDLQVAVVEGQKISIVQFVPDRREPSFPAGTRPFGENDSAVEFVCRDSQLNPFDGWLEVCGEFKEVRDLQNGFKNLGHINKGRIACDDLHGVDSRRRILLEARPEKPMLVLALSSDDSTNILDAVFEGPLHPADVEHLVEVVQFVKQCSSPRIGTAVGTFGSLGRSAATEAEKLLTSENPCLIWLGLDWLTRLHVLKARHYREVIERRPPVETESLLQALLSEERVDLDDLLPELEALIQLPEKQLIILNGIASDFDGNTKRRQCVSYAKLHDWLVGYKERLAKTEGKQEVIAAIDKVLPALTPDP